MAETGFKRFIPALIPIVMEIIKRIKRDRNHDRDIEKIDQTQEKLSTLENLIVKMEKKTQDNRNLMEKQFATIKTFLIVNSILLLGVLLILLRSLSPSCPW